MFKLTDEEIEKMKVEMEGLAKVLESAFEAARPGDIPAEKLVERTGLLHMALPPSRTMIIAAMAYVAMNAYSVTLDKGKILKLFEDIFTCTESMESFTKKREMYEIALLEAKAGMDVLMPTSGLVN